MVYQIVEMSKMTFKILLRNKFFLFFSVVLVVGCTCLLNISSLDKIAERENNIVVLEGLKSQMAYLEDIEKFQIKVYNSCEDQKVQMLLTELADVENFQIFELKSAEYDSDTILEDAEYTAKHDKVDAILLINKNFPEQIRNKSVTDSITIYRTGKDDRYELFEQYVRATILEMIQTSDENVLDAGQNENGIIAAQVDEEKTIHIEELTNKKDQSILDMDVDYEKAGIFGNAIALYTVAFLFSGIMILGTILSERDNRVATRIYLTDANQYHYLMSKFIVIVAASVFQTLIGIISFLLLVRIEIGLSIGQFALILFAMALIFNSLSVGIGICCGNTLTACLVSFTVWMCCCLLGGMYFDITNSSMTYKRIASLLPTRWGLKAASLFMNGNNQGYPLIVMVAVTYVVVILLIGTLGLRLRSNEN